MALIKANNKFGINEETQSAQSVSDLVIMVSRTTYAIRLFHPVPATFHQQKYLGNSATKALVLERSHLVFFEEIEHGLRGLDSLH